MHIDSSNLLIWTTKCSPSGKSPSTTSRTELLSKQLLHYLLTNLMRAVVKIVLLCQKCCHIICNNYLKISQFWTQLMLARYRQCLNCEKKKWRNAGIGAKGAETNAGGVRIEAPYRHRGANRLGVLGERRELPQRGPGGARPKTNLVHFVAARRTLIAIIRIIVSAVMDVDSHCKTWTAKMWPCLHTHTVTHHIQGHSFKR